MSIKRVSETNKEPIKAVLTTEKQKGVRTIYVDNLDGWRDGTSEDTAVPFVMYSKNLTTNEVISGSKTSWFGVVSKSSKTITNLILTGGEDQLYPAGTAVVATPTAQWANDLADALLTSHNPDGSLKAIEALKRIEPVFKKLSSEISLSQGNTGQILSFGKDDGLVSGKWYEVVFQPELSTGGRVYLTKYSILAGADELIVKYNQNAAGEWHSSVHISLPIKFNGKDINLMVKNEQGEQALNVNTRTMAYIKEI